VYRKQVRRRRAVLVLLVLASVVLLTSTFGGGGGGPFTTFQHGVATALSPLEDGASRALKPARDLVNWVRETFNARGENSQLKAELRSLRLRKTRYESALGENRQLRKLVGLGSSSVYAPYKRVTARVIGRSPTVWYSTVTIGAGSGDGVQMNDPVVTGDGLVGRVTAVTPTTSEVTLITDHTSAVSAKVLPNGPAGVVEAEAGNPNALLLDFVDASAHVHAGQHLVTAGWSNGRISSAYPYGIQIGRVTQATRGVDQNYQRISVRAFADLRGMDFVQILTGGPKRPGVRK
jgi:rod shape-determining protein MreC